MERGDKKIGIIVCLEHTIGEELGFLIFKSVLAISFVFD